MSSELASLIEANTRIDGCSFPTSIPGLHLSRYSSRTQPGHGVQCPTLAIVAQGSKQLMLGDEAFTYDPGHCEIRHKASAETVGSGTMMALAPGKGIMAHREADATLHAYVALNKPEHWIAGIDFSDPVSTLARVAAEFDGWAPELTALLTDTETDPLLRPIYALPVEHRWERVAGVTLLGDAAHLMSPFAGEGANLAMYDGAELGKAIAANLGDVEAALAGYEKDLFPRSASAAAEAGRNLKLFFDEDSPQSVVDLFGSFQPVE